MIKLNTSVCVCVCVRVRACVWVCVCVCSRVGLCDPMDCSLPGSSEPESLQARTLEWVATLSSRGSSCSRLEPESSVSPALQVDSSPLSHLGSPSVQSVQFSRAVVSDSLRPRELQHGRAPCPSPAPGVHPNLGSPKHIYIY